MAMFLQGEREVPKYRVCLLGSPAVGKTSLVTQCLTSDYMNTYDASLGNPVGGGIDRATNRISKQI